MLFLCAAPGSSTWEQACSLAQWVQPRKPSFPLALSLPAHPFRGEQAYSTAGANAQAISTAWAQGLTKARATSPHWQTCAWLPLAPGGQSEAHARSQLRPSLFHCPSPSSPPLPPSSPQQSICSNWQAAAQAIAEAYAA